MRVLIADDSALTREALSRLIQRVPDFQLVGEAADGDEAIRAVRRLRPDLVLMDIAMPRCDGLLATRVIKREFPEVRVVVLTVLDRPEEFWEAIRSGAQGYLVKHLDQERLVDALNHFARDDRPLTPELARGLLQALDGGSAGAPTEAAPAVPRRPAEAATPAPRRAPEATEARPPAGGLLDLLTDRERDVALLVAEGCTDREIAQRLLISEHTVKNHVKKCLAKTRCRNRTQLAKLVAEAGAAGALTRLPATRSESPATRSEG